MPLPIIAQEMRGRLLSEPESGQACIIFPAGPDSSEETVFLRYALVLLGSERPLLPSFLLDDWGREIKGVSLFEWIFNEGERFPRAEVVGYVHHPRRGWKESQFFVRDLELVARWPVFATTRFDAPPEAGIRVHYLAREDPHINHPSPIDRPENLTMPLKRALVSWWVVPHGSTRIDLINKSS